MWRCVQFPSLIIFPLKTCLSYSHSPFSPLTELGSPFIGHSREISCFSSTTCTDFLIVTFLKTNNKYICSYHFHTVTVIEAFGQHNRNLAMSLHKQLHFAVFYKMCFINSAPGHTDFSNFQNEKQDISQLGLIRLAYKKCSIIPRFTEIIRVRGNMWTCDT